MITCFIQEKWLTDVVNVEEKQILAEMKWKDLQIR